MYELGQIPRGTRSKMADAPCNCMLCKSRMFSVSDAALLCDMQFKEPTILCQYIEYWRTMFNICCCLSHDGCDHQLLQSCVCPRCCRACHLENKPCDRCKTKNINYYPCYHEPGLCKTYIRSVLRDPPNSEEDEEQRKEEPMKTDKNGHQQS